MFVNNYTSLIEALDDFRLSEHECQTLPYDITTHRLSSAAIERLESEYNDYARDNQMFLLNNYNQHVCEMIKNAYMTDFYDNDVILPKTRSLELEDVLPIISKNTWLIIKDESEHKCFSGPKSRLTDDFILRQHITQINSVDTNTLEITIQ